MHDVDVRSRLHKVLSIKFAGDTTTIVVDELGICQGQVRVDVAAINGHLYGFEIKSATDTLKRLDEQVRVYSRVLDFSSVVVSQKHLIGAQAKIPPWWGIYLASVSSGDLTIETIREPEPNPEIDARAVAELLWHQETLDLLLDRNALHGIRSKPRRYAWDRLCEVYSLDEIRTSVRCKIKERQGRKSELRHV
jgi:hypothetical protein